METLQIIYTTAEKGQFITNIPLHLIDISSKYRCLHCLNLIFWGKFSFLPDTWKKEAIGNMTDQSSIHIPEEIQTPPELSKISLCIITEPNIVYNNTPEWYDECEGKMYFTHGVIDSQ